MHHLKPAKLRQVLTNFNKQVSISELRFFLSNEMQFLDVNVFKGGYAFPNLFLFFFLETLLSVEE